jgi:FkbM family methyltransferase
MSQFVFNKALRSPGEIGRFFRRVRRWILRFADPIVTWEVNGRKLRLNLSHKLPFYRREFPTYASNLERLAGLLRRQYGSLMMIDVGANVGDSLALAGVLESEPCLLIEGDADFFRRLQENTAGLPDATCVAAMLSDSAGETAGKLVSDGGTGAVVRTEGEGTVKFLTLDQVIRENPRFIKSQLLKIDVDGYDFRVMRGGERYIRDARPVLFFEQDPGMMQAAGESADGVYDWLGKAGYERVYLYDNIGYLVGAFSISERAALRDLNEYARQRRGFYYDVAAFAGRHADVEQAFRYEEKQFFKALKI